MQAILLTLATNPVITNKRKDKYWDVEKRWIAGDYINVMRENNNDVKEILGL